MPRTGPRVPKCAKCGQTFPDEVDGSQCGGFPGVKYVRCNGCGHTTAKRTRRPSKRQMLKDLGLEGS